MSSSKERSPRFVASILKASSGGLASFAANLLVERGVERGGRPSSFSAWNDLLDSHIAFLAAALSLESPGIYRAYVEWSRLANSARGIPVDSLGAALTALGETLEERLPVEARGLAADYLTVGREALQGEAPEPESRIRPDSAPGALALNYLLAVLEGQRGRASELILEAHRGGLGIPEIYKDVLQPVQEELGRMWMLGEIHVAEEHFGTATTELVMSQLFPELAAAPRNGLTVVASAVAGDGHQLGIRMVSDFLEMAGWKTVYLGASVPPRDLQQAVVDFEADLLALSASLATQLEAVATVIRSLREDERTRDLPVLVGGKGFRDEPEAWRQVGADGYAANLEEALAVAQELVRHAAKGGSESHRSETP